jgi:hypothetical protein
VYDRYNLKRQVSVRYSLAFNGKANLTSGDQLVDLYGETMATIVGDTVGEHWWLGAFCSEALNFIRTGTHGISGCRENLAAALEPYGLTHEDVRDGGCLNFFMKDIGAAAEGGAHGASRIGIALSERGDFVELLAERDVIVAISACPDSISAVNGYSPSPLSVVIYESPANNLG